MWLWIFYLKSMKSFFGVALLLVPCFLLAQTKDETPSINLQPERRYQYADYGSYSYSVGFKIMSIEEFPQILNQESRGIFRVSPANGFIIKYNDKQVSYRLSGSFFSDRIGFTNGSNGSEELHGRLNDNQIKLGFEKNFTYTMLQPYLGMDFGFKRSVFKGHSATQPHNEYRVNKNGVTISPVIGVKLNVSERFTFAAESTLDIFYFYDKQEINPGTSNAMLNKFYKWDYLLKPLGQFSLSYNFSRTY